MKMIDFCSSTKKMPRIEGIPNDFHSRGYHSRGYHSRGYHSRGYHSRGYHRQKDSCWSTFFEHKEN